MRVAIFSSRSPHPGRWLTYEDRGFAVEGIGSVSERDVIEHARQGHLEWTSDEWRGWAQGGAAPAPVAPAFPGRGQSVHHPFYGRWYFWVGIAALVLILVAAVSGGRAAAAGVIGLIGFLLIPVGLIGYVVVRARNERDRWARLDPAARAWYDAELDYASRVRQAQAAGGASSAPDRTRLDEARSHVRAVYCGKCNGNVLVDETGVDSQGHGPPDHGEPLTPGTPRIFRPKDGERGMLATAGAGLALFVVSGVLAPPLLSLDVTQPPAATIETALSLSGKTTPGARVTVNGTAVTVRADGTFVATVPLRPGANRITVDAKKPGYQDASSRFTVVSRPKLRLDVAGLPSSVESSAVVVRGSTMPGAAVRISAPREQPVAVAADGSFVATVALGQGDNRITVEASKRGYTPASRELAVTRTLPKLSLRVQKMESAVTAASVDVAGKTTPGGSVKVNGRSVSVGADGTFNTNVALSMGDNAITITASKAGFSDATSEFTIKRNAPTPKPKQWVTVATLAGSTEKKSEPFHLTGAPARLVYRVSGGDMVLAAVYVVPEGTSLEEEGGIPEVTVDKAMRDSTILALPVGDYYFDVRSANCDWSVEIQEQR